MSDEYGNAAKLFHSSLITFNSSLFNRDGAGGGVISVGDIEVHGFNEMPRSAAASANKPLQIGVVAAPHHIQRALKNP
jgi:hypothetical protein